MNAPKKSFLSLDLLDNRYPALHGLRVFAIISVIQFHITWIFAGEQNITIDATFRNASLTIFFGMDLFFMLSGFLIGSILLRSLEEHGSQNLRRFYLRRIFRTFPSYYIVLTYLACVTALTASQLHNLRYEYLYVTNFMPLGRGDVIMFWGWSLALEEQFYLTVPLLFFVLHRLSSDKLRIGLLAALWASGLVVRLAIFFKYGPWTDLALYGALYFRTYTRFDTLVAGILLAFVNMKYEAEIRSFLRSARNRAILALGSLACLRILAEPAIFGAHTVQLFHVFAWGSLTTVMYFPALLLLIHGSGPVTRFLSWPIFRKTATLGYGVYLVHIPLCDHFLVPAARYCQTRNVPMFVIWPVSLVLLTAASLLVGYIMHVTIEKPSLKLRQWLAA